MALDETRSGFKWPKEQLITFDGDPGHCSDPEFFFSSCSPQIRVIRVIFS